MSSRQDREPRHAVDRQGQAPGGFSSRDNRPRPRPRADGRRPAVAPQEDLPSRRRAARIPDRTLSRLHARPLCRVEAMTANRIVRAQEATAKAELHINEARNTLMLDRRINSLGIYMDVQAMRANIQAAKLDLDAALNSLWIEWPRPDDYKVI